MRRTADLWRVVNQRLPFSAISGCRALRRRLNHYPRHLGDWLRDTVHLTEIEECIYSRCIDQYYSREAPLPLDVVQCARLVRANSIATRKALDAVLCEFFVRADDGWHQKRCDEEIVKFRERTESAKASAKASVEARRKASERSTNAQRTLNERSTETECKGLTDVELASSHKPVTSNQGSSKTKAPRKRGTPIPEGFTVSDSVKKWSENKGYGDLLPYLEIFVSRSKASGKEYVDWDQALENAIREDWYDLRKANGHSKGYESRITEQERVIGALTGKPKGRVIEVN